MGRIVIAGGTGFLGRVLTRALELTGHEVVVFSRKTHTRIKTKVTVWNGLAVPDLANEIDGSDAVINLSGQSISVPWTEANKKLILDSRVNSTRAIGEAIAKCASPPKVWINASATGIYGDRENEPLDESKRIGVGFLPSVCSAWEEATKAIKLPATRCVQLRTGVVLGRGGGAFESLLKVTRDYLGGPVGSGEQWMPWIHIFDWVCLVQWLLETDISGPVNAVAPQAIKNADLMKALRKATHRPWAPRVPKFALNLASKLGGPDPSLLLDSARVVPKVALDHGFKFQFSKIDEAVVDLLHPV